MIPRNLVFSLALALAVGWASALEVSQQEWFDPGRIGSAIWLINPHKGPRTVDSLWVRNTGFQRWREARFKIGNKVRVYSAGPKIGKWILLKPKDKQKIRVKARDSLMVSSFEVGDRLMAGSDARDPKEDFSLELRIVDNVGKACTVGVFESRPAYIIEAVSEVVEPELEED